MDILSPPIARQELVLRGFHGEPGHIHIVVERRQGRLDYAFRVEGTGGGVPLILPSPKEHPERRDDLWRHTCFELFLAGREQPAYLELNLSPGGDWNLYAFDGYRLGMRPVDVLAAPVLVHGDGLRWHGCLLLQGSTIGTDLDILGAAVWDIGVAAVLEYEGGRHEYWALAHPAEHPDFHRREAFLAHL